MQDSTFIGLDVHKATISVAVAQGERGGEVRHWGTIPHRPDHVRKLVEKLGADGVRLHFCYEAGPCGYGLHRQLVEMGHNCIVVAPSLIPVKAGDRVQTDRRDAVILAKLHRAGELTAVWLPDTAHEAMRDLVRARATAMRVLGKARQHLQGFLLRHGRIYPGKKGWTVAYRRWLTTVRFQHPAQQIVFQDYVDAVADAEARAERLTGQIADLLPSWSLAPVVEAVQAMRGVALRTARLMPIKTLESFDFSFQPSLDRNRIMALAQLEFIKRAEVLHFLGPPGTGKSHLATAIGVAAVKAGRSVYRCNLAELIEALTKAEREGRLGEKIRFYARASLLIVDEIGYLPITSGGANLFFQLVNARYEKGAMILTSNRGFAEWGEVFGDPVVATALLDRLLHHAVVVQIEGASYRQRHHADLIPEHTRSHATITPPPPPKRRGRPPKNGGAHHMHG